jgi:NADPH-dependent 2,4-dienoyl-CoA reductase/sulfur reductase-like enzyme/nitrite reductase/ring-hydroxylating ferredoxin subunit
MKEVDAGGTKVLLTRVGDKCHAIGANCTHYGAPLVEGALVGDNIICPWHHACFRASTRDLLEPPALDALPNYPVEIVGDEIIVELPDEPADRRMPDMAGFDAAADGRTFVIIGGGAAGYAAAQTLREEGYKGRIVMLTREARLPYDRPNLSKDYLQGHAEPEWMPLRPDEFFAEHGIEVLFDKEVTRVDAANRSVVFANGEAVAYDTLLIATGGTPRTLDVPGSDLANVLVLRSFASADDIVDAVGGAKNAVVIGASFIGMETAASLRSGRGLAVTVIAPGKVPFEKTLGPEIGEMFQRLHEYNGVKFRMGSSVVGFEGKEKVEAVLLEGGERIEADLVIVGVGVQPATGFLDAGVQLEKDGGIVTDQFLMAGEGIYAAGDIVHFPDARSGETIRIEHWRYALQQGRSAARNMAGKQEPLTGVPFFWTRQFDETLTYVGYARHWERIVFDGDVRQHDFVARYMQGEKTLAVAGMNRDHDMALWQERIHDSVIQPPETNIGNAAV